MVVYYVISLVEDDVVIWQCLFMCIIIMCGEFFLKKFIKKFMVLVVEIEKDDSKYVECEKLYCLFLQELVMFELFLLKIKVVIDVNCCEQDNFKELYVEFNQQIFQVYIIVLLEFYGRVFYCFILVVFFVYCCLFQGLVWNFMCIFVQGL